MSKPLNFPYWTLWNNYWRDRELARLLAVVVCLSVRLSVRPSVTSRCSTETAKRRIMQTTPPGSPENGRTVVFWCPKSRKIQMELYPNRGAKCRWGRLNVGKAAENWQLSTRSVVSLARSQVYHSERPPARSPWCSSCWHPCYKVCDFWIFHFVEMCQCRPRLHNINTADPCRHTRSHEDGGVDVNIEIPNDGGWC